MQKLRATSRRNKATNQPTADTAEPKQGAFRAQPFRATRKHHSTEAAEDYTELILDLIEDNGEARTCEVASLLGISHVTALRTMRRLMEEGFVETSPHKPITLTAKGKKTAHFARERHALLVNFFVSLGVPRNVAEVDVEGAEHHISPVTLRCIRTFLNKKMKDEE